MDILSLAENYVTLKKKSSKEWAGPCPGCGGDDRFVVWPDKGKFYCRQCEKAGDVISFLREFGDMSCPDAHEAACRSCSNRTCAAWDNCRLGARANGEQPKKRQPSSVNVPAQEEKPAFVPDEAQTPQEKWQKQAAALISKAHAALLDCPEQIDYLTARGIPLEAIQKGQLGWIPANRYPAREAWGLPTKLKPDGTKRKMFIPSGILIPFFDADRNPHRIRIRRNDIRPEDGRYFWLSGSGNDVPVVGGIHRRGVVVVESDLDAFMVRWQCRDFDVSVIPLGSCGIKPKSWAMQALEKALAILVAHDFEPRINEETGKHENPGGQGAQWWLHQFSRAKRWPVPAGKDPGEYYQDHGGDICAWVLSGLPPVFHVSAVPPKKPAAPAIPEHSKGTTVNGHDYVVAHRNQDVKSLSLVYPEIVVFSPDEIHELKGMSSEDAEKILIAKKVFCGTVKKTSPVDFEPEPLPPEPKAIQEELIY
jgi:DNA primase